MRFARHMHHYMLGLALLCVTLLTSASADAQIIRSFTSRFSSNAPGDIELVGNSIMSCPLGGASCAAVQDGTISSGDITNNNAHLMSYTDVDNDASTFNSSSSTVSLPLNANVLWAGLYWGGRTATGVGGMPAPSPADKDEVRLNTPTTNGYVTVTASQCDDATGEGDASLTTGVYQCFADVTNRLPSDGDGVYTVANVQSGTGNNRFAGWGLVIVYEDPSQPLRNLVVYDGFALVISEQMMGSVNINLSGFRSPATGDIITRIGAIGYEGDRGAAGDSFRVNGTAVGDAFNDSANFFNAGISSLGQQNTARSPSHFNNLGFDLKKVEVTNLLANNSMTATLKLDTSGDNYFPGVVTFGTTLYAPDIQVSKTVELVKNQSGDIGQVVAGDLLEYTIEVSNQGQDGAVNVSLEDIIPRNTTYVANSGRVDGAARTDALDGDNYTYDAQALALRVNLGAGASNNTGGRLGPGQMTTLKFQVKINDTLTAGARVENQASIDYVTETLMVPGRALSDGDPVSPGADGTVIIVDEGTGAVSIDNPADSSTTLNRRPTISGTATPNSQLTLVINGTSVTVAVDANGNWSYTPTADLPLGLNTVSATVQGTSVSDSSSFTIEDVGVEITSPANGQTTSTRPVITGKATPGATVELTLQDGTTVTVTADANGDWSHTPAADQPLGSNTVTATIPGSAATDSVTFTVSNDEVAITSPTTNSTVDSNTPTITGTANPGAQVEIVINGGQTITVIADDNGDWSYTPANPLNEGVNTVEVTNGEATDSVTFTVDTSGAPNNNTPNNNTPNNGTPNNGTNNDSNNSTTDPMVEIVTPVDGSTTENPPTITGTGTPGATVTISIDGETVGIVTVGDDGTWSFTPDDPIAPGAHVIEASIDGVTDSVEITAGFPSGKIARGGSCASAPGHDDQPLSPLTLLLVALGVCGFFTRRRRDAVAAAMIVVLGAVLVVDTGDAVAQELTSFQVEHFEPLPSQTRNVLNISSSQTLPHLDSSFGVMMHLVNDPLQLSNPDGSEAENVIRNQFKTELNASLGLFDLAEIGLVAPLVLFQSGDDLESFGRSGESIKTVALADFRLIPKITILPAKNGGLGIAVLIPMYIPFGDEGSFNSDGKFRFEPRIVVDWSTPKGLLVSANVAYQLLRGDQSVYNFVNDDILRWGLGTRIPIPKVDRLAATGSIFGNISFAEAQAIDGVDPDQLNKSRPIEMLIAAEYGITRSIVANLGGGTGLTQGVGAPDFRVVAGIGYAPAAPLESPASDTDGDGIIDEKDACPTEPEDFDKFEDEDGCPDLDNDQDTILDVDDKCPLEPEDMDEFQDEDGCPDPDNDEDGLLDLRDSCPNEPEDFDEYQDDDGCPDPDNDDDKILDVDDKCPMVPERYNGIEDEDGCPEKDTDKDGIIDPIDKCPTEPETYNGTDDEDGCPDGKELVVITETEVKIFQKVFFDTNKDTIKKRSYKLLNTVATVLNQNPQVTKVRIEGHTDDIGKSEYNLDLSERRAAAVRQYLIAKGVAEDRLNSRGYGEDTPLCTDIPDKMLGKKSSKYKTCRADNRRVEFKITELNNQPVKAADSVKIKKKKDVE